MSVHKNSAGRWSVRIQVGGQRISRSLGPAATKADAKEYEAKLRREILAGTLGKAPEKTMDDALARWLQGEATTLKSLDSLKSKIRAIVPACRGQRLADVVQVAEKIKADGIRAGLAPATINRRMAILRRLANLAHAQWGWLDNPLGQRIKLLRGETARHIYLTPDQVETLADHCTHPGVALAIRLAARTGLRESELLAADTIFDGCIVVAPDVAKSGRPRLVPVPPDLPGLTLPLGINYRTLRRHFEAARKAAGMDHVRFHDLRHTAASWWAQAGANLAVLRDLLGHSTLSMTSRYAHLMPGTLKAMAAEVARKRHDVETRKQENKAETDEKP